MSLFLITLLSCAGMFVADSFATVLTVAEARGHDSLAGLCDVGNDLAGKFILVAYGGTTLTHHGVAGWLCLLPVLATGFFTTKYATRWSRRIKTHKEVAGRA